MINGKLIWSTWQNWKSSITVTRSCWKKFYFEKFIFKTKFYFQKDVFSKFAWAEPLKNKTSKSVLKAFAKIVNKSGRKPLFLYTDRGLEFTNKLFQRWLKKKQIHFLTPQNQETKAAIAERMIRTLLSRVWRYFTFKDTKRCVDVLPDFLRSCNAKHHRSIKRSPDSVSPENAGSVWLALYGHEPTTKQPTIKAGALVWVSKVREKLDKGILSNWSQELFVVDKAEPGAPPLYTLKDLDGETLDGRFCAEEIQQVAKPEEDTYRIEAVLGSQRRAGKRQVLVRWRGFPAKFDSWLNAKDVIRYSWVDLVRSGRAEKRNCFFLSGAGGVYYHLHQRVHPDSLHRTPKFVDHSVEQLCRLLDA